MKNLLIFLAILCVLYSCGSGTNNNNNNNSILPYPKIPTTGNVMPLIVDGYNGLVNVPYTSVTLCSPGTNNCSQIDHVLVDTGSSGLRIVYNSQTSSLINSLNLPLLQRDDKNIAECRLFGSGYTWGSLRFADLKMAGESAANITVHIFDDPITGQAPDVCANSSNEADSSSYNGIIGIASMIYDQPSSLPSQFSPYFLCNGNNCDQINLSESLQPTNLVYKFINDNNGTIITLPAVALPGSNGVYGSLIFGIGTQSNNTNRPAVILKTTESLNLSNQLFNGLFEGSSNIGLFDSGTNTIAFDSNNPDLPVCNNFIYCPTSTIESSAYLMSYDDLNSLNLLNFQIANILTNLYPATPTFGITSVNGLFIWGLPVFFGKSIYTAIESQVTPFEVGPYQAY